LIPSNLTVFNSGEMGAAMSSSKPTQRRRPLEERRIRAQISLIYELAKDACVTKQKAINTIFPLLDGIAKTSESILLLSRKDRIRDVYVLGRMAYETALNVCFIVGQGDVMAERAWRHAKQKTIRDLKRAIQFGDEFIRVEYSGADGIINDPAHKMLLGEFSTKNGKENRDWTPENITERLRSVRDRYGRKDSIGLAWGQFLYRHSSEITHGTLFSGLFVLGATQPGGPPKTVRQLRAFRVKEVRFVLLLLGATFDSLICILSKELNRKDIIKKERRAYRQGRLTKRHKAGFVSKQSGF